MEKIHRGSELKIASGQSARYEKYWLAQLAGEISKSTFPYDSLEAKTGQAQMESVKCEFSQEIGTRLIQLSNHSDSRLHMVLTAALNVLLVRYTAIGDIILGTPIYKQKEEGEFINTVLALRNRTSNGITFKELILQVRQTILEAMENQNYPLEIALEQLNITSGENDFSLFGVVILIENIQHEKYINHLPLETVFSFLRKDTGIELTLKYNTFLYRKETIERIIAMFRRLLEKIIFDVDVPVLEVEILSENEQKRILYEFNRTTREYPHDKTIVELFTAQAEHNPHQVAVVYNHQHLTYGALQDFSSRLAGVLRQGGSSADNITALLLERSIEMIIAIFAILKSGGAYLPLDPQSPPARNRLILKDSWTRVIITQKWLKQRNSEAMKDFPSERIIVFDHRKKYPYQFPTIVNHIDMSHKLGNLAYVLYTSGTTGIPKGVLMEHHSVNNLVYGLNDRVYKRYGKGLKVALAAPYIFDASVKQIFGTLLLGHCLYVVPEETRLNGESLLDFYRKERIDVSDGTPAHLTLILEAPVKNRCGLPLKHLLIGGESLPVELAETFFQGFATNTDTPVLTNVYGPAECCVDTTSFEIAKEKIKELTYIPIGTSMPNKQVYILDEKNRVQPIGVVGELYIGGVGVARGYLNRPELTAEKFCLRRPGGALFVKTAPPGPPRKNFLLFPPHSPYSPTYRTGDLGRWHDDGNIEFLGRRDSQVKIRGFRIELEEIRSQLLKHEDIRDAVTTTKVLAAANGSTRGKNNRDEYICAYIVSDREVNISRLKEYLSGKLPGYMIPSYFKQVERIPLTPNGKTDLKALPAPQPGAEKANYIAPANRVERKLLGIWHEVLGLPLSTIGMRDDFFDLGGHSLKAVMLINRIRSQFQVEFPLREIFAKPSIQLSARYIAAAGKQGYEKIQPVEKMEYYRCSSVQTRLYILQQMEKNFTAYNIPAALVLEGKLQRQRLEKTFRQLITRHDSLRTSFAAIKDQNVQKVHDEVEFEMEYLQVEVEVKVEEAEVPPGEITNYKLQITNKEDSCGRLSNAFGDHSPKSQEPGVKSCIHSFIRPFDLSQTPLLRVGLLKLEAEKHILMIDIHHIVSDGTSTGILIKDFVGLYAGQELSPLRIRYRDYSHWQNRRYESKKMQQQETFWLEELKNDLPVLNLPTDYERTPVQGFDGEKVTFEIPQKETAALKALAAEEDVTLYMMLLSVYYVVLARVSGQEDIIVGSVVEGRNHDDLRQLIGMFVNTLPLRNYPHAEKIYRGFLHEVKESTLDAFENRDYPFKELAEKVSAHRDISRNPLFDVAFFFHNQETSELKIPGLNLTYYEYENKTSRFDLTLAAVERGGDLLMSIEYRTGLFKETTIKRLSEFLKRVIVSVTVQSGRKIGEIEIISDAEKKQVLYDFNDTRREYPGETTIHELFEHQVERTPDNTALIGTYPLHREGTRGLAPLSMMGAITYRELNEKSERLAYLLKEKGVRLETIVAIMVERSLEMIIGILGILKAGAAYLPIDANYPHERIKFMLTDSSAQVLVVDDTPSASWLSFAPEALLNLSEGHHLNFPASRLPGFPASLPSSLAYVIYTSGSTGRPKGILIRHGNVVNFIEGMTSRITFEMGKSILCLTTISFDIFVLETLLPLTKGLKMIIANEQQHLAPGLLTDLVKKNHIDMVQVTPSHLKLLLEDFDWLRGVSVLLVGGEAFPKSVFNRLTGKFSGQVYNLYGPTETTVWSTLKNLSGSRGEAITIGRPISNTYIYILARKRQLQPIGVPGELCIGGDGLARGYLNQPELTCEKFINYKLQNTNYKQSTCLKKRQVPYDKLQITNKKDPYRQPMQPCNHASMPSPHHPNPPIPQSPIYRTGDLARWLPEGEIDFLGRLDHQVKIRGFRIELGEIRSQLLGHEDIKDVVVTTKELAAANGSAGGKDNRDEYICAYIVSEREVNISRLKEYLSGKLPGYMIPAYIKQLEKIPLTPNGKTDLRALPAPRPGAGKTNYIAPGTRMEKKLLGIWHEVLEVPLSSIGIRDNFFDLGGHSLKAIILINRIRSEFHVEFPLRQVFGSPTIQLTARYIATAGKQDYEKIQPVEKREYYRCSPAQTRLYILQQMEKNITAYNIPAVLELEGKLHRQRLEQTFRQLITRHESLRTSFAVIQDNPVQRVHDEVEFEIDYKKIEVEVKVEEEEVPPGEITNYKLQITNKKESCGRISDAFDDHSPKSQEPGAKSCIHSFIRPFDISRTPLLRVGLVKLEEEKHILMIDMPHIISDGTSTGILAKDFMGLYAGKELSRLRISYRDYSHWQNRRYESTKLQQQEAFWLEELKDDLPVLNLPGDYKRKPVQDFEGDMVTFEIPPKETALLKSLAAEEEATLYMVLLSVCYIVLFKVSGQEDMIVGSVVEGRNHDDLRQLIGMFINTLPLRNYPHAEKTYRDFLHEVRECTLNAFENQDYPFEELVEKVPVHRDISRNPLFDVAFVFHNQETPEVKIPGLKLTHNGYKNKTSKFDLTLAAVERGGNLLMGFEYRTRLFKESTINRFIEFLKNTIASVLENPGRKIREIEIIFEKEKRRILYDFNDTNAGYPDNKTISGLFLEQVEQTPDRIALIGALRADLNAFGDQHLSYSELNERSDQLASLLIEKGVHTDIIVGIMVERSIEMIIGIMGILKAGGAYLPIEPEYPEERIKYMLEDSKMRVLVTTPKLQVKVKAEVKSIYLTSGHKVASLTSTSICQVSPANLAYIIYTSGTTGKPKGTMVEHRNVIQLMFHHNHPFDFKKTDNWTMFHSYCFDFSVWEMYGALLYGGKLILITKMTAKDPVKFLQVLKRECISVLNQTPTAFYSLVNEELTLVGADEAKELHLRYVFFGGEALMPVKLKEWKSAYPKTRLVNMFGITETTVHVTYKKIGNDEIHVNISNIGKPIPTMSAFVMDSGLNLLPIGIPGELCVGGAGVSRGYLNRAPLTAEKFIENPYQRGETLYRSGDMVKLLGNYEIQYLGRIDLQVKIRGHRIEVSEIEVQLLKQETVIESVVVVREDKAGDKYLCAYIVPKRGEILDKTAIRQVLSTQLPDYMVPAHIVRLESIPLNSSGKIDRRILPEPELHTSMQYTAPRTGIEKTLVQIWSRVLNINESVISIDADFFEFGGHSLKAVAMVSYIHQELDVKLSLQDIFQHHRLEELAQIIYAKTSIRFKRISPVEKKEYYPLSPAQESLYIHQEINPQNTAYNMPRLVELIGSPRIENIRRAFYTLINRHESLRTSFAMMGGEPVQRIHEQVDFEINEVRQISANDWSRFVVPFDLSLAPLLRVSLGRIAAGSYFLFTDMHHIITDGISLEILKNEFLWFYQDKGELPTLSIQYKDYSQWQNRAFSIAGGDLARNSQQTYWIKRFRDGIPGFTLNTDFPRSRTPQYEGNICGFSADGEITTQLKHLTQQQGGTMFMALLTVYYILLSRLSNQEDIVIGSPVSGREHCDLEKIIGMFVNMLALRNYPVWEKTFEQFLREVKENTITALAYQGYPYEKLVRVLGIPMDPGRNPLFDVALAFHETHSQFRNSAFFETVKAEYQELGAKFDLALNAFEKKGEIFFYFQYKTGLFKEETIQRFSRYYLNILTASIANPQQFIGDIDILPEEEKKQLLDTFNDTAAQHPDNSIHQVFEQQAARFPDRIAVVLQRKGLTYEQLNEKANRIAHLLRKKGVVPGSIVGIILDPSFNMIAAILGILKAGGAYLPIQPDMPGIRILSILKDVQISILITENAIFDRQVYTMLQGIHYSPRQNNLRLTAPSPQVSDLHCLPFPDRSLVNYETYNRYIGQAMVKNSISLQATRGCPYHCAYCHKIWPKTHVVRSAENIFAEVKLYHDMGLRRFVFIDDIFNLDWKNSTRFFEKIIKHKMEVQLFFPNGMRGDILTKEYIDLMVEAGTVSLALALETASPRLQKLIKKNLNLEKLKENIRYFCKKYPQVILELFTMHGFPTETEKEALMTLDFINSFKWLHFPYVHILKIYPETDMEKMALENGISEKAIASSANLAYHELPDTLPFDKDFTLKYQGDFLNGYFLSKERLLYVLPHQMEALTEDEILQKYNSYLPIKIKSFHDLLELVGIPADRLDNREFVKENRMAVPHLNRKIRDAFPREKVNNNALKVLFLDLSQFFSSRDNMLYDVVEAPLGLMYVLTYLKQQLGGKIDGKIAKSRIDFDNYQELKVILEEFKPDIIGIRTLTFYKDFFHQTVAIIRQWGIDVPIIVGGPYATSDYKTILQNFHVDIVVLSEGEIVACQLIEAIINNKGKLPPEEVLENIPGIAFVPFKRESQREVNRELVMLDTLDDIPEKEFTGNLPNITQSMDLAYVIFTSGSTGKPKGAMIHHKNVVRLMFNEKFPFVFGNTDVWTMFHSYSFDFSVWEMYGALLYGGKLVLVPHLTAREPEKFLELLIEQKVTVLNQTPSAFYNLMARERELNPPGLKVRYVIFGGEALKPGELKNWQNAYPKMKLINMFGITETTVHVTYKEITSNEIELNTGNIGKPLPTLRVYILDRRCRLVPTGAPGELCVSGDGVAVGYLNRPALTLERFVRDPFRHSETLYKSGDMARWLPGGDIEYLGRVDHQVKVRGYRIEPGEIENCLLRHEKIKDVVVLAAGEEEIYLTGYIVPENGSVLSVSQLKKYLSQYLSPHMIPDRFVSLEKIPLTPNDKVDRHALRTNKNYLESGAEYQEPGNRTQEMIVEIWQKVLELEKVGIKDSFFDLGGNSLLVLQVVSEIKTIFGVDITVIEMFEHPTIDVLSKFIDEITAGGVARVGKTGRLMGSLNSTEDELAETIHFFEGN